VVDAEVAFLDGRGEGGSVVFSVVAVADWGVEAVVWIVV
jgi:hypothetical protein